MYPAELEAYWLGRARAATGTADGECALDRVRPAVRRLSDLFTLERPRGAFPDYATDAVSLAAYGLFFFPQSFARTALALDQPVRLRGWRPEPAAFPGAPLRVLDLGSGAGPCGLAALRAVHALAPRRPLELVAVDHSPGALALVREVSARALPSSVPVEVETRAGDLRHADAVLAGLPPQDIIVAGFSVNELFGGTDMPALRRWLAALRPLLSANGLLVVLEPALRDTALSLQGAADALAGAGVFHRWGPDLGDAPCPLTGGGRAWSHEVRRWTPPASLAYLNRRLFREIGVLKFACTVLCRTPPEPLPEARVALRLVSPLQILKGRLAFSAVTVAGELFSVEIPTRGLSKREIKTSAAAWERGDVVSVDPPALQSVGGGGVPLFRVHSLESFEVLYLSPESSREVSPGNFGD
ncbi:MAG: class I SAM-dependent methyltransferase [Puniceicoccales bacterium]|jgi:SAM-dependent methyltransferase|nr:class I SAM-dependent methyltransferase [Puniceicoccales bacterium]